MVSKIIFVAGLVVSLAASTCAGTTHWLNGDQSSLVATWNSVQSKLPSIWTTTSTLAQTDTTSTHARALKLLKALLSTGRFASLTTAQKQTAVHDALVRAGINPEKLISEPGLWSRFTQWLNVGKYLPGKLLGSEETTGLEFVQKYITANKNAIHQARMQIERYDTMSKGIGSQFGIDLSLRNKDALSVATAQTTFLDDAQSCYHEATKAGEYAADTLLSPTVQQAVAAFSKGATLTDNQQLDLVHAAKLVRNQLKMLDRCLTEKETALLEKVTKVLHNIPDGNITATKDFVQAFKQNAHRAYVEKTFGADVAAHGESAIFEGVETPQTWSEWLADIEYKTKNLPFVRSSLDAWKKLDAWKNLNEFLPQGTLIRAGAFGTGAAAATYVLTSGGEWITGRRMDMSTKLTLAATAGSIVGTATYQLGW